LESMIREMVDADLERHQSSVVRAIAAE